MERMPDHITGFSIQDKASLDDRVCLRITMEDLTGKRYEAMVTVMAGEFTEVPPQPFDLGRISWNAQGAPR